MYEILLVEIVVVVIKYMVYCSIFGVFCDMRCVLVKIVKMILVIIVSEG